ncbi:MAG: HEAT repeat domain-containing protein [Caldilineaceae bacterium]|nr:HEAT repeat domain-containing protein [Caldilineaceae bacterium]
MQQQATVYNQPQFESLAQWLARQPLLAPLHGMHTRVKEHYPLGAEAMAQLLTAADHPNPKVRWFCAHELDHLATNESIDMLLRLTQDPVAKVRVEAVHALGCDRCKQDHLCVDMVGLMVDFALNDSEEKVRSVAIHALGYLPADRRAAEALQQIVDNETTAEGLRKAASHSLQYHPIS